MSVPRLLAIGLLVSGVLAGSAAAQESTEAPRQPKHRPLKQLPLEELTDGLEYDVKAVFLLNFSRYITWPQERLTPPFRICVLEPDPFGRRLAAAIDGERWQDGKIEVREVPEVLSARNCHLLYVPRAAARAFAEDATELAGEPVLTVGETRNFLAHGGMIRFFLESNKVRFSINQANAESVRLQISSRLLRLAREVIEPILARLP
jgi:YfiR/HmsC-like